MASWLINCESVVLLQDRASQQPSGSPRPQASHPQCGHNRSRDPGSCRFHKLYILENEAQINLSRSPFDQLNGVR